MKIYDCVPGFEFDEKADLEQSPVWFLDGTHSVPPWTPMFGWLWINFCRHGMQYGAETLQLPTVHGWDWRFKDGGAYLTLLLVGSEVEKKAREVKVQQAIRPRTARLLTGMMVSAVDYSEDGTSRLSMIPGFKAATMPAKGGRFPGPSGCPPGVWPPVCAIRRCEGRLRRNAGVVHPARP
jgi:hypothetical protein